jgi:DNA-binding transcriptional LysR family regulator
MELRHICYFIRVVELLHFTHAAESLDVSQPTLSIHIQRLKEEIGCPLFERGRTGSSSIVRAMRSAHLNKARKRLPIFRDCSEAGRAGAITARLAAAGRSGLHIFLPSGASLSRSVGIFKHRRVPQDERLQS